MQHLRERASVVASAMLWCALASLCHGARAQGLTLHYQERAPYSVTQGGRLRSGMRGAEALALAGATLLLKDGYSYGPQRDRLIAAQAPPPARTSAEAQQMLSMLVAGRGGWIIVTPEESQVLRDQAGAASAGLRQVAFADISAGETRHLYCNKAVPDAWLARVDQALSAQAR